MFALAIGITGLGCGSGGAPAPAGTDDGDTNAYSTLVDELQIEVLEGSSGSAAEREFRLVPEDLAAESGLAFVWQIGHSFGFEGLRQTYIFGSSGTYPVRVEAFDAGDEPVLAMEATVEIEVPGAVNVPPTAVATAAAEVSAGELVYLDGQDSSDPDSFVLSWSWTQSEGPSVALKQADEARAFFYAPLVEEETVFAFTLNVRDELNASTATVELVVLPAEKTDDPVDPADGGGDGTDGGVDVDTGGVVDSDTNGGTGGLGGGGGLPPFESGTLVDDTAIDWATFVPPPRAIKVRTETELRAAGWESFNRDVAVLVLNDMSVNEQVYFPTSSSIAHLVGIGAQRSLNFNLVFNGNWNDTAANQRNAVQMVSRHALLRNIRLTGLQLTGAGVKGQPSQELLSITRCAFEHIGDQWFAPRIVPAQVPTDTVYTQCIAVHGMSGHVDVRDNAFRDSATNQHPWGHVLYASGRTTSVLDNLFERTGNPFSLGYYVQDSSVQVLGNVVRDVQLSADKSGNSTRTILGSLGLQDYSLYMQNTFSGLVELTWVGHTDGDRNYFGENNYDNITHGNWFAADQTTSFSRQVWEQRGFDIDPAVSLAPCAVLVRNEAELRAAAARTATEPLVILVGNSFTISDTVVFPAGNTAVRLVGCGTLPTLTFNMVFNGDWSNLATRTRPGLDFRGRRAFLRNLALTGYQLGGPVVRAGVTETFEVSKCEFRAIGTQAFLPRVTPPASADDTIATRALAVGSTLPDTVVVTGSRFVNCATNQADYGAVLELGGRAVVVADNTFETCGNLLSCRPAAAGAGFHVMGNSFTRPALTVSASGAQVMPYLCRPPSGVAFTFLQNTVSGIYRNPWQGLPDLNWFLAVDNTYSAAFYEENWAVEPGGAGELSWTDWRALGLD